MSDNTNMQDKKRQEFQNNLPVNKRRKITEEDDNDKIPTEILNKI